MVQSRMRAVRIEYTRCPMGAQGRLAWIQRGSDRKDGMVGIVLGCDSRSLSSSLRTSLSCTSMLL